jgi:hypothetical protein
MSRRIPAMLLRTFECAVASLVFLAACGSDRPVTETRPRVPAHLKLLGGGQTAIAGQEFQAPTIVVTDSAGIGMSGVVVTLRATGAGSVVPTETQTGLTGGAIVRWRAGPGEDSLTVSVAGLADATITSRGLDTLDGAAYELRSVDPAYVVGLTSRLLLEGDLARGSFYTGVQCSSPATCHDSGWGTYVRSDSVLYLSYANNFWDTQYSDHQERGVFRGDTLLLYRVDAMWAPYSFTLAFVCETSRSAACH